MKWTIGLILTPLFFLESENDFAHIGCFKEGSPRAIATIEGSDPLLDGAYNSRTNAIIKCSEAARNKGFEYFSVQHGGLCAGSATAQYTYDKYGATSGCVSGRGAHAKNDVYRMFESKLKSLCCIHT